MGLQLLTEPAAEPLTVAEVKAHLRVESDVTDEDAYIGTLIVAARQHVEEYTRRALVTQSWTWTLDRFRCDGKPLIVPRPRLQSVTSIKYLDLEGALQTLDAATYVVDAISSPGRIALAYGASWPSIRDELNAVRIVFAAGYGGSVTVPATIKAAMKLLIGVWFENREAVVIGTIVAELPFAVEALLGPYRCPEFA